LRALTGHYQGQLASTLADRAAKDPDEWVQRLCKTQLTLLGPATQPATQPANP
jgi:hypothetical protein